MRFEVGDVCVVTREILSLKVGDIVEIMDVRTPHRKFFMMRKEEPIACVSNFELNLFAEKIGRL